MVVYLLLTFDVVVPRTKKSSTTPECNSLGQDTKPSMRLHFHKGSDSDIDVHILQDMITGPQTHVAGRDEILSLEMCTNKMS